LPFLRSLVVCLAKAFSVVGASATFNRAIFHFQLEVRMMNMYGIAFQRKVQ
jgi:hypothetical protein